MRKILLCPIALALAALSGCDLPPPRGPAWGEWKGSQPGAVTGYPRRVDLTLEGSADAPGGRYDIVWIEPNPGLQVGIEEHRWAGTYQRRQQVLNGSPMPVIALQEAPPAVVSEYVLFPDGSLRALQPGDGLGNPKLDALYTLRPAPRSR